MEAANICNAQNVRVTYAGCVRTFLNPVPSAILIWRIITGLLCDFSVLFHRLTYQIDLQEIVINEKMRFL